MRFFLAIRFLQENPLIKSTLAAIYLGVSVWTSYDDGRFCITFALCIRFIDLFSFIRPNWNKSSYFLELFFFILFWYAYFCSFQLRCNWKSGLEVFDLKPIYFNISFELIIKSEFLEGNDIIIIIGFSMSNVRWNDFVYPCWLRCSHFLKMHFYQYYKVGYFECAFDLFYECQTCMFLDFVHVENSPLKYPKMIGACKNRFFFPLSKNQQIHFKQKFWTAVFGTTNQNAAFQ